MTVLVDTGVLYADHDTDAARHDAASDGLEAVYDGEFGLPYVSDYVYDEAVTLALTRGGFGPAKRLGERLRGADPYPRVYELLFVSAAVFDDVDGVADWIDPTDVQDGRTSPKTAGRNAVVTVLNSSTHPTGGDEQRI